MLSEERKSINEAPLTAEINIRLMEVLMKAKEKESTAAREIRLKMLTSYRQELDELDDMINKGLTEGEAQQVLFDADQWVCQQSIELDDARQKLAELSSGSLESVVKEEQMSEREARLLRDRETFNTEVLCFRREQKAAKENADQLRRTEIWLKERRASLKRKEEAVQMRTAKVDMDMIRLENDFDSVRQLERRLQREESTLRERIAAWEQMEQANAIDDTLVEAPAAVTTLEPADAVETNGMSAFESDGAEPDSSSSSEEGALEKKRESTLLKEAKSLSVGRPPFFAALIIDGPRTRRQSTPLASVKKRRVSRRISDSVDMIEE